MGHFIFSNNKSHVQKNGNVTRKSLEYIACVRGSVLILRIEDPTNLYKINKRIRNLTNSVLKVDIKYDVLRKFIHFIYRQTNCLFVKRQCNAKNLPDILLGFGIWALWCVKKNIQVNGKTDLQRNQTNGLLMVCSKNMFEIIYLRFIVRVPQIWSSVIRYW
jgi:hypothetical protein